MEYKCDWCVDPCKINTKDSSLKPYRCPLGGGCNWEPIINLEPCPFCGEEDSVNVIQGKENPEDNFVVNCDATKGGCGAQSGFDRTKGAAIERWNQRG